MIDNMIMMRAVIVNNRRLTLKGPSIFTVFHVGADLKLKIGM